MDARLREGGGHFQHLLFNCSESSSQQIKTEKQIVFLAY
jgi:hypothetical protein